MANDNKVIGYLSPADMVELMGETGMIAVQETTTMGGLPVIHAALKVINAQTGEQLPGGLPFTVIMFKTAREPGYSNIAIGTVVPTAELGLVLPRDYFNFSNQHYRFARVFPIDERAFVLQMDLFVHNATREYVKFSFGIWAALFSQVLFDLMGKGGQNLHATAEAYAAARLELSQQFVSTVIASDRATAPETALAGTDASEAAMDPLPVVEPMVESDCPPEPPTADNSIAVGEDVPEGGAVLAPVAGPEPAHESFKATVEAEFESEPESEPMLPPKYDPLTDGPEDLPATQGTGGASPQTRHGADEAITAGTVADAVIFNPETI